jgi:maltooligosyltrehalose trehalohydrolase
MGAKVQPDGSVRFRVWAPRPETISLRVAGRKPISLDRVEEDLYEALVPGVAPGTLYAYKIDGKERPDPVSRWQPKGVHGPSAVVDPAFPWTDRAWRGIELKDAVLYELHVGTFSPEGTFEGASRRLQHLKSLGATVISLMPVIEFPGKRNWGYDGVHAYAPHSAYGGPRGLKAFVDAAHRLGLAVCVDVVYNHMGPEGNYLREFGPYFSGRYHTPWGDALNYDDRGCDRVRRYFIENALYWITEFRADALRLDAIHGIYDMSTEHVLAELGAAVREQARRLGRPALVISESDLNDPKVVRPPIRGGWGHDAQWSDDFHHAAHVLLTGEKTGYYADYGRLEHLADAVERGFSLDGRHSDYRGRCHGAPALGIPAEKFVVNLQNHDQIGNRARGERLTTLASADALRAAAALLLLGPNVPMLFMGEEYGETRPFLYFISHLDPALVEAVRKGRQRDFKSFDWRGGIPDPQAPSTFTRSRLDWSMMLRDRGRRTLSYYKELLRLRRKHPALSAGGRTSIRRGGGWLLLDRSAAGERFALVVSLEPGLRDVPLGPGWRLILSSNERRFGGAGGPQGSSDGRLALQSPGAALFKRG